MKNAVRSNQARVPPSHCRPAPGDGKADDDSDATITIFAAISRRGRGRHPLRCLAACGCHAYGCASLRWYLHRPSLLHRPWRWWAAAVLAWCLCHQCKALHLFSSYVHDLMRMPRASESGTQPLLSAELSVMLTAATQTQRSLRLCAAFFTLGAVSLSAGSFVTDLRFLIAPTAVHLDASNRSWAVLGQLSESACPQAFLHREYVGLSVGTELLLLLASVTSPLHY